jgi:hypothetical protein
LIIHLSENSLSQNLGLAQTREKWFKNKSIDLRAQTPFLLRNRQKLNWDAGVPRVWLKDPWKDLDFLIQKYVTCEGDLA